VITPLESFNSLRVTGEPRDTELKPASLRPGQLHIEVVNGGIETPKGPPSAPRPKTRLLRSRDTPTRSDRNNVELMYESANQEKLTGVMYTLLSIVKKDVQNKRPRTSAWQLQAGYDQKLQGITEANAKLVEKPSNIFTRVAGGKKLSAKKSSILAACTRTR
jgi:hypothetical protein